MVSYICFCQPTEQWQKYPGVILLLTIPQSQSRSGVVIVITPLSLSYSILRIPNGVIRSSCTFLPSDIDECMVYNVGVSTDHSKGDAIFIDCSISVLPDGDRVTGVSAIAASRPDSFLTTDLNIIFLTSGSLFSIIVRIIIVADTESASGVVIYVPHRAIFTGPVIVNHTWR